MLVGVWWGSMIGYTSVLRVLLMILKHLRCVNASLDVRESQLRRESDRRFAFFFPSLGQSPVQVL